MRGRHFGLTRDTGKDHLIKATLESMAYQTKDILNACRDAGLKLASLKVDGGASANTFSCNFKPIFWERKWSDRSDRIYRHGAAYLAGIHIGLWKKESIIQHRKIQNGSFLK